MRWGGGGLDGRPESVGLLQDAVVRRRQVRFTYAGADDVERVVDPNGLVDKDGVWYLLASTKDGERTFRLDRMTAVHVSDVRSESPSSYDLTRQWATVVSEVERRRSVVSAIVLAPPRLLPVLQKLFGRHCRVLNTDDDGGRVRLRVAAHLALSIAETLAGFGNAVEVVEPAEVRTELARLGAELALLYRSDPSSERF